MRELPIHIELEQKSGKTLYEQIYEHIREEIRKGNLLQGERLPSARFLADYLQISRTTVDMAYGQLVAEGYLIAKPKSGYFVGDVRELYNTGMTDQPVEAEPLQSEKKPEWRYDFSPTAIDMSQFPYATWKKITKNIMVDARSRMFALGEPQGDMELRRTICRYLHGSRGVNCDPEQIIIGAGNDFLLLLLEKILGRRMHVAMENPTYIRAYKIFRSFAYPISLVPMDDRGLRVDKLEESGAKLAYVMPSRQYPTGISMPIGRRMELLRWAGREEERYLIEDDYDSEFRYKGKPIPSLQASDQSGRVIYMGTFSKSIAPAIRVGYMVLPESLLDPYRENCGCYASTVSRIDQRILNEFIKDGYFERYLNRMRKIYREKHDYLLGLLAPFEKNFKISGENAGLHLLLTSKQGVPEEELLKAAEKEEIRLYGMSQACMQGKKAEAPFQNTILMGYGAMEKKELQEGIECLKKAWRIYL